MLDRLVGYLVSPKLSQDAGIPLSAGRVQSPAVKLVALRENEIAEFRMRNFYDVRAEIGDFNDVAVLNVKTIAEDGTHLFDESLAKKICEKVTSLTVKSVIQKKKLTKPKPAFSTSTLQQSASSNLKLNPKKTMDLAQSLFEAGLITYHRTDSQTISEDGFALAASQLKILGFSPISERRTQKSNENAQEAHEAIRPTTFEMKSDSSLDEDQERLFKLICERTLKTAMPEAEDSVTEITFVANQAVEIEDKPTICEFMTKGLQKLKPGFRVFNDLEKTTTKEQAIEGQYTEGESLACKPVSHAKSTEPPKRYTEASLVNALEKLGIGRPATYASIMENIKNRGYIALVKGKDRQIEATDKGQLIVHALRNMAFMGFDYTKVMEKELDKLAKGEGSYKKLMSFFYSDLRDSIDALEVKSQLKEAKCDLCSETLIQKTKKKGGYYWVHKNSDTECLTFIDDKNGEPVFPKLSKCPKCGNRIKRLYSDKKKHHFWVHLEDDHCCDDFMGDEEVGFVA